MTNHQIGPYYKNHLRVALVLRGTDCESLDCSFLSCCQDLYVRAIMCFRRTHRQQVRVTMVGCKDVDTRELDVCDMERIKEPVGPVHFLELGGALLW